MSSNTAREDPDASLATASLRRHGRSFYWAGRLLSGHHFKQAATLYSICRQIDDIADEAVDRKARVRADSLLASLDQGLQREQAPAESCLRDIYTAAEQLLRYEPLAGYALRDLIATVRTDLHRVRFGRAADLLQYCYGAAGTVGVMMTCLLGAEPRDRALPHAIDLGIAMQMTNIARDVLEDARMDRVYLPAAEAGSAIRPEALIGGDNRARHHAWSGVCDLLNQSETYYASAWQGLQYLPWRPRLAIAVAACVYREIGRQILRRGEAVYWQERSVVSKPRKTAITAYALVRLLASYPGPRGRFRPSHERQLHKGLRTCLDAFPF